MEKAKIMRKIYANLLLPFFVVFLISVFPNQGYTQHCTLTCIENLQVSLNTSCEAEINYRMVLQDPDNPFTCSPNGISAYKIVVMSADSIPLASSPKVTCEFIGQSLTVKAKHWLTGNSCWSTIKIEDKIAPRLTCTDMEVWCNESVAPVSEGGTIPLPVVSNLCPEECEELVYLYEDKLVTSTCSDDLASSGNDAKIERKWTVCDPSGNCGSCTQNILLKSVAFADIALPQDITLACDDTCDISLATCVGEPLLHGLPLTDGHCKIKVSFEDAESSQVCEGSSTITRVWTLINDCTNDSLSHTQVIEIKDDIAPSIICSNTNISVTANPTPASCSGVIQVPGATVSDNCSSEGNIMVSTSIYQIMEDGTKVLVNTEEGKNGGFSQEVPYGTIAIVYTATDDCGNTISNIDNPCTIEVRDDLAPTPVCNASTKLSLGADGQGIIFARSFDNGSYDNCCLEDFQVRRMDQENSDLSDYVEFSCLDSGAPIMVVLSVTDCSQNSAICMVEVVVDDKNAPTLTCPEPVAIDCNVGVDINQIDEAFLGTPTFEDACHTNLTYSFSLKSDNRNECGLGSIIFEWLVADPNGNERTCEQVVSVNDATPFKVEFPDNIQSDTCLGGTTPNITGEPVILGVDCEQIEVQYRDSIKSGGTYCMTIERTWIVENVCSITPSITEHIQLIEIEDTQAPIIDCGVGVAVCIENDACDVAVEVAGISAVDCSEDITARVEWLFTPAADCIGTPASGTVENGANGFTAPRFGPGTLVVKFFVSDICGNESICDREYIIKDCKAPTVACQSGVVLPLDENGTAVFWASDFDLKSVDNCQDCANGELLFSFSENVDDGSRLYTCDNIGDHPLIIYVSDSFGNQTFCETNIIIQSPLNTCDGDGMDGDGMDGDGMDGDGMDGDGTGMTVECGSTTSVCILDNSCTTTVNVVGIEVSTTCTGPVTVDAHWRFVPATDCGAIMEGDALASMTGFTTPAYGIGTLYVTFKVNDSCGEEMTCERIYIIEDCKAPEAVCLNGITIDLEEDGTFVFWAKDFNQNSVDNCEACGPLYYSFSENMGDSSIVFGCNDVGPFTTEIFVTDAAGNQSSCISTFTVGTSPACGQKRTAAVAGEIYTSGGKELSGVNVLLEDMDRHISNISLTGTSGTYYFDRTLETDYMLKPEKEDGLLEGITTFDLILLKKHILGKQEITSPYELIAADVNNSGTITAFDLIAMRKAILFIDDQFPNNTSWRFIRADQDLSSVDPLETAIKEEAYLGALDGDLLVDFIAIKIGDLNGTMSNLQSASSRSNANLPLNVSDKEVKKGEVYDITFNSAQDDLMGIQFTIDYDSEGFTFLHTENNTIVQKENIGLSHIDKGLVTISWDSETRVREFEYTLSLRAKKDGLLSEMLEVNSTLTPAFAYTNEGEEKKVSLNFTTEVDNFTLLQNVPNPFTNKTIIPFNLPQQSAAKIVVMNTAGKTLKVIEGEFEKGYNEVILSNLNTTGLLYYRIETAFGTATGKMIQVK